MTMGLPCDREGYDLRMPQCPKCGSRGCPELHRHGGKCSADKPTAPPMSPHTDAGDLLKRRLTDVVFMLDAPDAYNREYITAVCRSILASLATPADTSASVGAAQAPISSDDLTDYVVDAALSEYWDLSPRGWSETQRVAMRKAILTALAVPSAQENTP